MLMQLIKLSRKVNNMTQEEKADLIKILESHNIEDDIKWFAVDKHGNILGFKTKPYLDEKGKEWKSLPVNQHPIYYANFNKKVSDWKTMVINIDDLQSKEIVTWSKYQNIDIEEKLNAVFDSIAEMLKTVLGGKEVFLCDSYANIISGYVSSVNREDKSFDFTTDDAKIMRLPFADMWLSKSPFHDSGDGDLYISINGKLI